MDHKFSGAGDQVSRKRTDDTIAGVTGADGAEKLSSGKKAQAKTPAPQRASRKSKEGWRPDLNAGMASRRQVDNPPHIGNKSFRRARIFRLRSTAKNLFRQFPQAECVTIELADAGGRL